MVSQKMLELMSWSQNELGMKLELDKTYVWLALSGRRKNYLGLQVTRSGNQLVKKGLTGGKRHTPAWVKYVFNGTLDILKQMDAQYKLEPAQKAIRALVQTELKTLRRGEVPVEALQFTMGLQKDIDDYENQPIHVKVAKQIEGAKAGDIIKFVKTYGGAKPTNRVVPAEVNIKDYEKFLKNTLIQIFDCIGIKWSEIDDLEQTTLFGEPLKIVSKVSKKRKK